LEGLYVSSWECWLVLGSEEIVSGGFKWLWSNREKRGQTGVGTWECKSWSMALLSEIIIYASNFIQAHINVCDIYVHEAIIILIFLGGSQKYCGWSRTQRTSICCWGRQLANSANAYFGLSNRENCLSIPSVPGKLKGQRWKQEKVKRE